MQTGFKKRCNTNIIDRVLDSDKVAALYFSTFLADTNYILLLKTKILKIVFGVV